MADNYDLFFYLYIIFNLNTNMIDILLRKENGTPPTIKKEVGFRAY